MSKKKSVIVSAVLIVLYIAAAIGVYFYFKDNAWPADYRTEPQEWAKSFRSWIFIYAGAAVILNIICWVFVGMKRYGCPQHMWLICLILSFVISAGDILGFLWFHPEESICKWICGIAMILLNVLLYWRSTAMYPSHWCFYPFE